MTDAGGSSGAHEPDGASGRLARGAKHWAVKRLSDDTEMPASAARASDAEREAAAEQVRAAVEDGRLGLDELDERLAAAYAAKTRGELQAVTADLASGWDADPRPLELRTKSGTLRRSGHWIVPARIIAECTSGTITLDFTEAVCHHREVVVQASAASGSVVLIVPQGWGVDMDNVTATSGSLANKVTGRPTPGSPTLRVDGKVKSGTVKARYPRRTFWQWLTRAPRP